MLLFDVCIARPLEPEAPAPPIAVAPELEATVVTEPPEYEPIATDPLAEENDNCPIPMQSFPEA